MLAATSLGATWSSCSPDFGINGVVDRFGQIAPKVLFTADAYGYGGKRFDCLEQDPQRARRRFRASRNSSSSPIPATRCNLDGLRDAIAWPDFTGDGEHALSVRDAAVRSSALHHVFVRHDRRAEMHRARRGRHADSASERTRAAHGRQTRGSSFLLHDLRLDDVELARVGPRGRRDAGPLRRIAFASGRQRAVGSRRRGRHQCVRHQREVDQRDRESRRQAVARRTNSCS